MQSILSSTDVLHQTELVLKASPRGETHSCDQYRALLDRELEDEMMWESSVGELLEQPDRNIEQEISTTLECPHPPMFYSRRLKGLMRNQDSSTVETSRNSSLPEMLQTWRRARNRSLGLIYDHVI